MRHTIHSVSLPEDREQRGWTRAEGLGRPPCHHLGSVFGDCSCPLTTVEADKVQEVDCEGSPQLHRPSRRAQHDAHRQCVM